MPSQIKKLSYRSGTARRDLLLSVEILLTAAQQHEK